MYDQADEPLAVEVERLESAETTPLPGVIAELGTLGPNTLISEDGIAQLFDRHRVSVKRAVQNGQLPPPCKLFGSNVWTVGVLIRHIEQRLEQAAVEAERDARRLNNLSPLPSRGRR